MTLKISCESYTIGKACKDGHNGKHPEIGRKPDQHLGQAIGHSRNEQQAIAEELG